MRKQKDINLRKMCLKKNFLLRVVRCPNQDVNEADVDAPYNRMEDFPQSVTNLGEQLPATQNAEKRIGGEIPSKRSLEDGSQTLMPLKKKRKILNSSPRNSKPVSDLAVLPQVRIPSRKCKLIPIPVLHLYTETDNILDNVERDLDSFFEEEEEDKENCCNKDSPSSSPSADDDDLVFKEITTFKQRHEYKKFYNRNLLLARQLKDGIELSNEYLSTLRQIVKLLPVYPNHNTKLIAKFNKALLSYKANPVHKQFKTVGRNLVLVKMLVIKFNRKNGLTSGMVNMLKRKIEC